ncbi:uncharacterized protein encoded by LINC02881-like [Suncus etruscus]|uniref:uncharacterized protein encoded by LINC02881-like n=1 Tax=Suncus etruscus TaxID=109475 RepID=UPI00210F7616|nr:uncharacterized protein encoded by LINC02881-like [Suncus etruscus]
MTLPPAPALPPHPPPPTSPPRPRAPPLAARRSLSPAPFAGREGPRACAHEALLARSLRLPTASLSRSTTMLRAACHLEAPKVKGAGSGSTKKRSARCMPGKTGGDEREGGADVRCWC